MNLYLDLISIVLFSLIVSIDLYKNKEKIKFSKGIIFRYSEKFIKNLENFVKKYNFVSSSLSFLSLLVFIPSLITICFLIFLSLINLKPTIGLVLPTVSGYNYPGPIISVPFFYWIISIFLVVFFHETMHAVLAIKEGIKVKKYGLLYLLIIPVGAFVEVDEKKLDKKDLLSKIKIYSAGSLGNFLLAALAFTIAFLLNSTFSYFFEDNGVHFESTIPNSPAYQVNLSGVIQKIDNQTIKNTLDLQNFLSNKKPNETVTIYTTAGKYTLKLAEKDNRSFIGINNVKTFIVFKNSKQEVPLILLQFFYQFLEVLKWIFVLSIGIGLANMIPLIPLDGGLVLRAISIRFLGKTKGERISRIISVLFLLIIVFSVLLSLKYPLKVF